MNLERILTGISIIGALFAAYLYLDEKHYDSAEGSKLSTEVQRQITALDRDRNEKIRVYYESKEDTNGELSSYDKRRYEQVLRDIDIQDKKLLLIDSKE